MKWRDGNGRGAGVGGRARRPGRRGGWPAAQLRTRPSVWRLTITQRLKDTQLAARGGAFDGAGFARARGRFAYATLRLDSNGTLAGSTGCRTLTGSHVVVGGEILATGLGADGECSSALADQDGHIVSVLGDGFRADVDGDPRGA